MSLLSQTHKFIEKEVLFTPQDRLLLAVSGGRDSMVMLHLLHSAGYDVSVAHVNYRLRSTDADEDATLVEAQCASLGLRCHIYEVSELELEKLQRGNLQAIARDIRYRFFDNLCQEYKYQYICTAHHAQDRTETFFLHLMRGSGLTGLSAMSAIKGDIRRPLLTAQRENIDAYAKKHNVIYREDASNVTDKYDRNYVRHNVIPAISQRWQHAVSSINQSMNLLSDSNELLLAAIQDISYKWRIQTTEGMEIGPLDALRKYPGAKTLLYHLLREYSVPADDIERIINQKVITGAHINSAPHYSIIFNRNHLLIRHNDSSQSTATMIIDKTGHFKNEKNNHLLLASINKPDYSANPNVEVIDHNSITYPLTWRAWQQGDRISPIGMDGKSKLVSDILIDAKIDMHSKRTVEVLVDAGGQVIWLMGMRASELFKVTTRTTQFLELKIITQKDSI